MKIVIGSKNEEKRKILENSLREINLDAKVLAIEVDSGITNQPLNSSITKRGATNRAKNAQKEHPDADFWYGLEGGLKLHERGYHLVTFACLIDKDGDKFIGEGEEIHLPQEVSDRVKKGAWFGNSIREYAKDHEIDKNLITRLAPFTQAAQNAYANYLKEKGDLHYREKSLGVIQDENKNYLIVQLTSYGENDWNFAGGGIEENETPKEALLRELSEELGSDKFEIVKKSKLEINYDWPDYVIVKRLIKDGKAYRGQNQHIFLVKFTGQPNDIKPDPGEIRKVQWVPFEQLEQHSNFPNQWELTKKIIRSFE